MHDPLWLKVMAVEFTDAGTGAKNREAILAALRTLTPIPADDLLGALGVPVDALVKAVGLSEKTVKAHLKVLQADQAARVVGHVTRQGDPRRHQGPPLGRRGAPRMTGTLGRCPISYHFLSFFPIAGERQEPGRPGTFLAFRLNHTNRQCHGGDNGRKAHDLPSVPPDFLPLGDREKNGRKANPPL